MFSINNLYRQVFKVSIVLFHDMFCYSLIDLQMSCGIIGDIQIQVDKIMFIDLQFNNCNKNICTV